MYHGRGNGVVEHHHGIVGHAFNCSYNSRIWGQSRILRSGGVVMHGGDRGL